MFIHATPPVAQLAVPAHVSSVRAPMQVDPDTATLTAQPYLRLIRWVGVNSPINVPKVAVLDTGIQQGAAGLQGRIDSGWATSFVSGGNALVDPEGHGTHVAGIIAAVASGTSTRPGVSILPVQVADAQGSTSAQAVASGIRYAVSRGAKVINLSLQGAGYSKVEQSAIDDATRAGALVIAASGNTGTDAKEYPGAYRHVLAVGAVDPSGKPLPGSTRGLQVAVAAPGQDIVSSSRDLNARFETRSGTSMAAAIVSGVAARILAARPTLSPAQVTDLIMSSGSNPASAVDRARGTGVVNLVKALRTRTPLPDGPEPDDDPPNARLLPALIAKGQTQGERYGRLRTWADLRDDAVVRLEAGQVLRAEATVTGKADVDLYVWRPGAPAIKSDTTFPRKWLAMGAVNRGSAESLTYRASQPGDYVLEVRLAGAQRIIRPSYHLQVTVS
jgi:hypothetical protein